MLQVLGVQELPSVQITDNKLKVRDERGLDESHAFRSLALAVRFRDVWEMTPPKSSIGMVCLPL